MKIDKPYTSNEWDEYFDLRWRILREPWNQPRGSERDDYDQTAEHLSVRDESGRLLGIGRLHQNDSTEAQIRYMATEEHCRGLGIGRTIVKRLEELARNYKVEKIVLNARETAVGFYERLGYTVVGPAPTMFGKVKHSRMEKRLFTLFPRHKA